MNIVSDSEVRKFVYSKLLDDQSPESMAGRIRGQEHTLGNISKDSIYRYIKSVYGRKI